MDVNEVEPGYSFSAAILQVADWSLEKRIN